MPYITMTPAMIIMNRRSVAIEISMNWSIMSKRSAVRPKIPSVAVVIRIII
jgi:hypothetical protein